MAEMGMRAEAAPYREINPEEIAIRVREDVQSARTEIDHLEDQVARLKDRQNLLKTFVKSADSFMQSYFPPDSVSAHMGAPERI